MKRRKKARKRHVPGSPGLPVIRPNVAGVDIDAEEIYVAGPPKARRKPNVRVFGATTPQLEAAADWLASLGVESVAMESTGVYWIPLYELLEARGFEVYLVNGREVHNVPGRKSDMNDSQWIQLLHSCGLLRASYRPAESICALRALRRQMENLVAERSKTIQWMQKALDQMNVRVHRAVTDLTGKTGLSIVRAIVAGGRDPRVLAELRDPRCRKSVEQIAEDLTGNWREEHLFNLGMALRHYDHLESQIAEYDAELTRQIRALCPPDRRDATAPDHAKPAKRRAMRSRGQESLRQDLWRLLCQDLTSIDGVSATTALTVATEVGPDLDAFPDEKHFISWLRLAPGTRYSGGKPLPKKKASTASTYLSSALRMAATTLRLSKSALGAAYRRIAYRKGQGVAIFAMARKLASLIYRMLRYGQEYVDEGMKLYEERFERQQLRRLISMARERGYELKPAESAA